MPKLSDFRPQSQNANLHTPRGLWMLDEAIAKEWRTRLGWPLGLILLGTLLGSCGGYPRYLNFPYDAGGRSLNSRAEELTPQVAFPYLAFVSDRNGSQGIYLFDMKAQRLLDLPGLNTLEAIASHPSVTEDGRYLVFGANRQGKSDIYLYDRQTQQKRNLTESLNFETRNPTISADGDRLAFEVAKNGQWDIMIMDRFGTILNNGPLRD